MNFWSRARVGLFALGGALIALALAGRTHAILGPFKTTLDLRASFAGQTTVRLAPLGTIELDTHDAPVGLDLTVDELRLSVARRAAADPTLVEQFGADVSEDLAGALRALALRAAAAALIGGLAGAVIARASWRSAAAGGGIGLALAAGVGGWAVATLDGDALAEPRYTGILTVAPTAVGDVAAVVNGFGEYRAQLAELVGNVATLYDAAQGLPTTGPGDTAIRVLHVSDLHLNPQAFDIMREVVGRFDVDAIVDTGDITDWGTSAEVPLIDRIAGLEVPYVFVRGNHDSGRVEERVRAQPNAVVLDGDAVTVAGLRIWGVGDPRYTPDKDQPTGPGVERDKIEGFAPDATAMLTEDQPPAVDLALMHDLRGAQDMAGDVPLVLAGHTHRAQEGRLGPNTVTLTEGSTGGAGLRGLQGQDPQPLTATVLYLDEKTRRLVAYDRITVRGLGKRGVTIARHVPRGATTTSTTTSTSTTTTGR